MWRVAVTATFLLAACSSSAVTGAGNGTSNGARTPTGNAAHTVVLTKLQNHTTVDVHVGDQLQVRLDSTYWRFGAPGGAGLRSTAKPSYAPDRNCIPGGGCGTVTAEFAAVQAGTAHVLASRLSCGEVVLCAPADRTYTVTVVVAG
jgi:hypothetical protein